MKCGREEGGDKITEIGVCPASTATLLDGKNSGKNGGRYCWKVSHTLCNGEIQGDIVSKIIDCIECDFLKKVKKEEGENFVFSI